jgi:hypothetical protein
MENRRINDARLEVSGGVLDVFQCKPIYHDDRDSSFLSNVGTFTPN